MALVKTWYTMEEAVNKFGLSRAQIGRWVEIGVVRNEGYGKHMLLNGDDLELNAKEYTGMLKK